MDKQVFVLSSNQVRRNAVLAVMEAGDNMRVEIKPRGRTPAQNAFSHAWYEEISEAFPEDDELGWKCYCKLHHGVPILRAEDEEFRLAYDGTIKGLTYEQKLLAMRVFPVTSRMNVGQLTKYANAVRDDFAARGLFLEVKGT
ncbi:recombination protein NinB [Bordetella hinzii]|nr:recombination protein NinB [Bordetella hinzii]